MYCKICSTYRQDDFAALRSLAAWWLSCNLHLRSDLFSLCDSISHRDGQNKEWKRRTSGISAISEAMPALSGGAALLVTLTSTPTNYVTRVVHQSATTFTTTVNIALRSTAHVNTAKSGNDPSRSVPGLGRQEAALRSRAAEVLAPNAEIGLIVGGIFAFLIFFSLILWCLFLRGWPRHRRRRFAYGRRPQRLNDYGNVHSLHSYHEEVRVRTERSRQRRHYAEPRPPPAVYVQPLRPQPVSSRVRYEEEVVHVRPDNVDVHRREVRREQAERRREEFARQNAPRPIIVDSDDGIGSPMDISDVSESLTLSSPPASPPRPSRPPPRREQYHHHGPHYYQKQPEKGPGAWFSSLLGAYRAGKESRYENNAGIWQTETPRNVDPLRMSPGDRDPRASDRFVIIDRKRKKDRDRRRREHWPDNVHGMETNYKSEGHRHHKHKKRKRRHHAS